MIAAVFQLPYVMQNVVEMNLNSGHNKSKIIITTKQSFKCLNLSLRSIRLQKDKKGYTSNDQTLSPLQSLVKLMNS